MKKTTIILLVDFALVAFALSVWAPYAYIYLLSFDTKNHISYDSTGGGKYGYSFNHFHNEKDELLFLIGDEDCSSETRMSIFPGRQALFSLDLIIPKFKIKYGENFISVRYDIDESILTFDSLDFNLENGKVFILRKSSGKPTIHQYDINFNGHEFGERDGIKILEFVCEQLNGR